MHTFWNCQAIANWTGIEYAMSSFYELMNLSEEALTITQNVDERFRRLGVLWNHSECGDHYYRPQSSWAIISSVTGVVFEVATDTLMINQRSSYFSGPWFGGKACGTITWDEAGYQLACTQGEASLRKIQISLGDVETMTQNGQALTFTAKEYETYTELQLDQPVSLTSGDTLVLKTK